MTTLNSLPDLVNKGIKKIKRKGSRILSDGGFIGKLKNNIKYFELGLKEEAKSNSRKRVENNIKRVRNANPDMADRMESEFNKLKKQGKY